jgi:hypothetical protein
MVRIYQLLGNGYGFCGPPSRLYKWYRIELNEISYLEVGSNTSTVALRVVGGSENGSLESETVKYGHEFHGTRTRE